MLSKEEIEKAKEKVKHKNRYIQIKPSSVVCIDCINNNRNKHIEAEININPNLDDAIETLLQYITQLEQENNKQNKMIDEMLDEYEYNARCNLNNFCDEEMRKDKCIQDCRICIKQYFKKKVRKSKCVNIAKKILMVGTSH